MPRITTPQEDYIVYYPQFIELCIAQQKHIWPDWEADVTKDIQDMRVHLTESEYHGVVLTSRLFTQYELDVGREYWLNRILKSYPRIEIQRLAAMNGMMELVVHAPFYAKLNEALDLHTPEFYTSYKDNPVLLKRKQDIDSYVANRDPLISTAAFTFVEGAILYSSFAYLKHFQTKGKNKLVNLVRGINYSVRDENLHALGGAHIFRQHVEELRAEGSLTKEYELHLWSSIQDIALNTYMHECKIIDLMFEKGPISGISSQSLKDFAAERVNLCLTNLGYSPVLTTPYFATEDQRIANWFYDSITTVQFHDFFTGVGNEYRTDVSLDNFVWDSNMVWGA